MRTKIFLSIIIGLAIKFSYSQSCSTIETDINFMSGTLVDKRRPDINCHQYVRTALLNKNVNLADGTFKNTRDISDNSSWISTDTDNFVKVCRKEFAEAICFSGISGQPDHSALVLSKGIITGGKGHFASTPGSGSYIYSYGEASMYSGGGTEFYYFAVLPKISGNSSLSPGNTSSYSIQNKDYIKNINWSVSSSSLQIDGASNGTSVNIKASCNSGSGTFYLKANITIKDSYQIVTIKKPITISCTVIPSCFDNTIDGENLNTFNYVSANTNHQIIMGLTRSWNKSSGSTNYWYTRNSGKEMNFSISNGCATFQAYNGSCGTQTFIFCATSGYHLKSKITDKKLNSVTEDITPFAIYDFNGKKIREGILEKYDGKSPLQMLPDGFYILKIYDTSQKVYVRN